MARSRLKILIVSTPRTGNTWVKYCLSLIYDLPVLDFPAPDFWRRFDSKRYDQLGDRWIAHQHLPPFEPLVQWARSRGVILITTTRHPADTLVSVYHYVRNFRGRTPIDPETCQLLSDDLEVYVRERFFKALHFSISWLQRRFSHGIRYEDLWYRPFETVRALTDQICRVSGEHISACLQKSRLEQMRKDADRDAAFFHMGSVDNWKTSLPAEVVQMLRDLPPYPSQVDWLGYKLDDYPTISIPHTLTVRLPPARTELPFPPPRSMAAEEINCTEDWRWLNSASDEDPEYGRTPPVITNLGTYIYEDRPDLQVAFPDPYGADRVAFSHWFTEVNFVGSRVLDAYFLVPVYESWLKGPKPSFEPIHCPAASA